MHKLCWLYTPFLSPPYPSYIYSVKLLDMLQGKELHWHHQIMIFLDPLPRRLGRVFGCSNKWTIKVHPPACWLVSGPVFSLAMSQSLIELNRQWGCPHNWVVDKHPMLSHFKALNTLVFSHHPFPSWLLPVDISRLSSNVTTPRVCPNSQSQKALILPHFVVFAFLSLCLLQCIVMTGLPTCLLFRWRDP